MQTFTLYAIPGTQGIYADPRTDSKSYTLGFETDSSLPADYKDAHQQEYFNRRVELYASAIAQIFLQKYFVEEDKLEETSVAATIKQ